jgi:hypothetical protein
MSGRKVNDDRTQFVSSNATVRFFAPDDTLFRTGCAMAVGLRFP